MSQRVFASETSLINQSISQLSKKENQVFDG